MSFLRYEIPATPQSVQADPRQIQNHAGGWAFPIDKWQMLDRFLTIGTESGTYYVGRADLTKQNADNVQACLAEDGPRTVARAAQISDEGRAVKQDYGLFVLALALASPDHETRQAGYGALLTICRTASTLFQLLSYLKGRRGWSRGLRTAVARWYDSRAPEALAYQLVKYRQRHGFTHRDVLRLTHPTPNGKADVYRWAVGKQAEGELPSVIGDYIAAQTATDEARIDLAKRLPREALPTEWMQEPTVWEALLYGDGEGRGMPLTALIRNLGNLSRVGVLTPRSDAARYVVGELTNATRIQKSRVHPIALLIAEKVYGHGRGMKGSGEWTPVESVREALTRGFEVALKNVEPTGKALLVALDVSGSMRMTGIAGIEGLTAAEVALAMAYVHQRTESNVALLAFDTNAQWFRIDPDVSFDRFRSLVNINGGGTDVSLPYQAAMQVLDPFDAILTYTDSETWAGYRQHPHEAWNAYRAKHPKAKAIIAATAATNLTAINDPNVLQVSGFDAAIPQVIAAFIRS